MANLHDFGSQDAEPLGYAEENMLAAGNAKMDAVLRRDDTRSRFTRMRAQYVAKIEAIDEGLKLLDRNPDIEQLLKILGRVGY